MITIQFSPEDFSNLRFAYSPLVELTISYSVLQNEGFRTSQHNWVESARRATHALDLPYLHSLAALPTFVPDFLTPTPSRLQYSIEDELRRLLQTPDEVIRSNVQEVMERGGESELLQNYLVYPRELLICLVEDLRTYWKHALEPHWAQITSAIEGDILYRARQLAVEGTEKVLTDISPKIKYHNTYIEIAKFPIEQTVQLDARGLQLVPTFFFGYKFGWQFSPHYSPMMVYSARGVGQWQQETPKRNASLEMLMGAGRTSVLLALEMPATTTDLARKLYMTAGAVSQHLDKLSRTGLVEAHRSGKRVYYQLTQRGDQLLALFN